MKSACIFHLALLFIAAIVFCRSAGSRTIVHDRMLQNTHLRKAR